MPPPAEGRHLRLHNPQLWPKRFGAGARDVEVVGKYAATWLEMHRNDTYHSLRFNSLGCLVLAMVSMASGPKPEREQNGDLRLHVDRVLAVLAT